VAAYLASNDPSYLAALILYAAPAIYLPSKEVKIRNKVAKWYRGIMGSRASDVFKSKELLDAEKKGLGKIFRKAVTFDQTDRLNKISVPTYIIWGDRDTESSLEVGRKMSKLIDGSELKVIKGEGHNMYLSNPVLFYGTIKQILEHIK
jgi:pimeloyl-ACP methyl ester carboxylesterase